MLQMLKKCIIPTSEDGIGLELPFGGKDSMLLPTCIAYNVCSIKQGTSKAEFSFINPAQIPIDREKGLRRNLENKKLAILG